MTGRTNETPDRGGSAISESSLEIAWDSAHSPLPLQSVHDIADLFGRLPADVEEADEFQEWYPAEITKALIPCTEKGLQNDGPELETLGGHGHLVIEPDVHPGGPISASGSGTLAKACFLASQDAQPVSLLSDGQERLPQRSPRADNLLIRQCPQAAEGGRYKVVCNLRIKFTRHLEL